jgi:hypothetical protein
MDLDPNTFHAKSAIIVVNCSPRWKLVRQKSPCTARPVEIQDRVNDFSHTDRSGAAARFRFRDQGFYELPLLIRQVTGIWIPFHIYNIGQNQLNLYFSHTL